MPWHLDNVEVDVVGYWNKGMQMDLWVVAAATGAGYLAKYWKNVIGDTESSSGIPSGSSFTDNNAPSMNLQTGDRTRPSHIFSQIDSAKQYFSEAGKGDHSDEIFTETIRRDDPFAINVASSSAIDHEKRVEKCEECWNVSRLGADIPDIPEYSSWEMGFSHSFGSRKCLRTRCLQCLPLQYIKPRTSLDSCLLAQMQRQYAEMEDHIRTPLPSPCTPALRPFVITDGSRIISRASGDFRNEQYKEIQPRSDDEVVRVPRLPQIITKNSKQKLNRSKTRMGTSSNAMNSSQFDKSDGSLSKVLFCLGISIGVMASLLSSKVEVEKLKDRLKQSENLVEDLQEELEMKDSLTVRELVNDDDSQDIHELSFTHEKMGSFSNQADMGVPIRYANEESANLEKIESMSKIEAELEAELERLELSLKGSAFKGRNSDPFELYQELDQDIGEELVRGELNADIFRGKSSSEPTPDRGSTPRSMKDGVSPRELSLRLHEVIQSRLQDRICELEADLAKCQKRIQHLELEKNIWRDVSQSESSSTLGSPVARPLIMNLSGDALDAYNEAFDELSQLNGSQNVDSWNHDGNQQDDSVLSSNKVIVGKLNGIQNGGSKTLPNESSPNDDDCGDDGDYDMLLIKQIVEKARQGSPAILKAQKAMYG